LDNSFRSCDDPARLQRLCDRLSAAKIDALVRKWLRMLPHSFTAVDRRAGFGYDVSILQAELSLTQVLDRPLVGRGFFDDVIRHNLDLGRPDRVGLVFDRRVVTCGRFKTPWRFRTRVITTACLCTRDPVAGPCPYANICEQCDNFTPISDFTPILQAQLDDVRALRDDARRRGWDDETARHERVIASLEAHVDRLTKTP
jgi:hypothetical protein